MMRTRLAMLAALVAAGAAVLAACGAGTAGSAAPHSTSGNTQADVNPASLVEFVSGKAQQNNAAPNTGDFFTGPSNSSQAMKWVQLTASSAGNLNPVVVNGSGFVLYRFDKDTAHPSASHCDGACAQLWPPVEVTHGSRIFVNGVDKDEVGLVQRDDGNYQVTLHGWPLYRYAKDTNPGDTNGQGVGGTWFGVTPTGGKAGQPTQTGSGGVSYTTGTAQQHNAPPNTGDFFNGRSDTPQGRKWVQLTASSANGLNPIVVNGRGFTYYRFDKDTAHPSASHCDGACAQLWPPVEVTHGSRIFVDGVPTADVGLVRRDDGNYQVPCTAGRCTATPRTPSRATPTARAWAACGSWCRRRAGRFCRRPVPRRPRPPSPSPRRRRRP
jgi:predicted lipoprotein with Yx(FWY)xxD motif